jgi:hypothetical protein
MMSGGTPPDADGACEIGRVDVDQLNNLGCDLVRAFGFRELGC